MWPEKLKPASLMMPLCTGPVTMASQSPSVTDFAATRRVSKTYSEFAEFSRPGVTLLRRLTGSTVASPGSESAGATSASKFLMLRVSPSCWARSRSNWGSATMISSTPLGGLSANLTQRSGPMPAGSPGVIAIRCVTRSILQCYREGLVSRGLGSSGASGRANTSQSINSTKAFSRISINQFCNSRSYLRLRNAFAAWLRL